MTNSKSSYKQYLKQKQAIFDEYFEYLHTVGGNQNKYVLPVLLGLISWKEVIQLYEEELIKINEIANYKLVQMKYEWLLRSSLL